MVGAPAAMSILRALPCQSRSVHGLVSHNGKDTHVFALCGRTISEEGNLQAKLSLILTCRHSRRRGV